MSRIDIVCWAIAFLGFRGMVLSALSMRWIRLIAPAMEARINSGCYLGKGVKQWLLDLALLDAVRFWYCLPRLWIWTVDSAINNQPRAVELRDEAIQLARIKAACR